MRATFDANILVYANDATIGAKNVAAKEWLRRGASSDVVLTLQCLAEFANVAVRKLSIPASTVRPITDRLKRVFPVHAADGACLDAALDAVDRDGLSFWDAMLWAAARQANCKLLLSEDFQDGRTLGGVTFVNPFNPENRATIDAALPP